MAVRADCVQMMLIGLAAILIMPSLSAGQDPVAPERTTPPGQHDRLYYTATFTPSDFMFRKAKGYDTVEIIDGTAINDVGKPRMPCKEIRLALPAGMALKAVHIVDTQTAAMDGAYDIFPAQPPRRLDGLQDHTSFVGPDAAIYASQQPFPSRVAEFVGQTDLAGQGIAVIHLFPMQYIPASKTLMFSSSITLELEGAGGYVCGDYLPLSISDRRRNICEQIVKDMVVNPADVQVHASPHSVGSPRSVPAGGPYDHVIITPSSYTSYWNDLIEWYTKRGLRSGVVTTNWINTNCSGSSLRAKVQDFVSDAHSVWGTTYFLLGGEHSTNPSSGVPFEYRTFSDVGQSTPSDQCYSDYDDDGTHEVYVGRATVQTSTQAATFINKVINYEKNPLLTGYVLDVLLVGMDANSATEMEDLKDDIDAYIPSRFAVSKVYDSHGGNHKTNTIAALNAGQHLVNHADHGWYDYMGTGDYNHALGMSNGDVDNLSNNNQPSIVVSLACDSNGMDDPYGYDCISEHFVVYNANQAGLAFTGNTRSGLFYDDNDEYPYYLSNKLDYWWWRSLFSNNKYILGETLVDTKHNFGTDPWYPDAGEHCVWTFNLLGEPAMPIWTDTPEVFDVTHPATLLVGPSSFLVHVEEVGGGDVNDAYVCLWKGDEVYERDYTNPNGDVTLSPSPMSEGDMWVTVTKHNYLPYEGMAEVAGCSTCLGDVNSDRVVDGLDVQGFVTCTMEPGTPTYDCGCADVSVDGTVDTGDVSGFITYLLEGNPDC